FLVFLVFFILVIIVVRVSRRPRIVSDGDEAPVDQPGENFLGDAWGHVSSCLDVATFAPNPTGTQASTVMSTALRRSNVAVSNWRSNSRARRQESLSSVCVGGRAISAYLSRNATPRWHGLVRSHKETDRGVSESTQSFIDDPMGANVLKRPARLPIKSMIHMPRSQFCGSLTNMSTLQNEPRRGQWDETQIQTEAYIGILVASRRRFLTLGSFFEPDLLKK